MSAEVRIYASAVFETALQDWLIRLVWCAASVGRDRALLRQLSDPTKSFEQKQPQLLAALPENAPQPVQNFLLGMLANGDITLLDQVLEELNQMTAAAGGPRPLSAEITSAVELSDEEQQAIQNRLIEQFDANLDITFKVNPDILGGLVVRVGDKLIDTSLSSRMNALRQSLGVV